MSALFRRLRADPRLFNRWRNRPASDRARVAVIHLGGTEQMSQSRHDEFLAEYGEAVQDSPSQALEVVKGQIRWLEYVPESEFTTGERERILSACVRFYQSIRPLTAKYID